MNSQFEWQTDEGIKELETYLQTPQRRGLIGLWLILLAVLAFGLGMALGTGWRYKQAQQALWADLEAVIAELRTHLTDRNESAFLALMDPEDPEWQLYQSAWLAAWQGGDWQLGLPVAIEEIEFDGERAEATVVLGQGEGRWLARWDFVLRQGRWFLARPHWAAWGDPAEATTAHLALRYRGQDKEIARWLTPALDDFMVRSCRWIGTPPERCRTIIELTADVAALGTPAQAAEKRLFRPSLTPPILLDFLRGDARIRVLSAALLPLTREMTQIHRRGRDLERVMRDLQPIQPSESWARSAWRLRSQERDATLWVTYPSPMWSGWRAGGEAPDPWLIGLRRELAEAMVRDRLGLLVGGQEDVDGAWALAIGIAEWLAEPQNAGDRALPWAPLAAVGRILLDSAINAEEPMLDLTHQDRRRRVPLQNSAVNFEELRQQAREVATYIAMTWGPEAFGPLLDALGEQPTLDGALSQALNVDRHAFEAGWRAFRERQGAR